MKKNMVISAAVFLVLCVTALPASAYQYKLDTTSSLYNIHWATTMVDGTGYIPGSDDPDTTDSYYYSSWQDGSDTRDDGTFALGTSDMVYGDPEGIYEMWGGATGFCGKQSIDNWMVLGFDAPLTNKTSGIDMRVYQFGWVYEMEIFVSTDSVYTSADEMTWISLGTLDMTSKPFTWGDYGTSPYMDFEFDDYGITEDVYYVMFVGMGHWIDAVGSPVPVPGSVLLLGLGLMSLIGIRRECR